MSKINIPIPQLQIEFTSAIDEIRGTYLQEALSETINEIEIVAIDSELNSMVPSEKLKLVARQGLRGELLFAIPSVLSANPYLLGYYRLLLGFSQKEFYSKKFGTTSFKSMEVKGILTDNNQKRLKELSIGLINSACFLIDGIGIRRVSKGLLYDLTLLTLGPQLRGGANVKKGIAGIFDVFEAIHDIVRHTSNEATANCISLTNAAGRNVSIEFAPDPDIVIREKMSSSSIRNIIAIEVKAGTDFSNIHNRVGEAEKSHQKAKNDGYSECWTVVNVDRIDLATARKESPSTNRFYRISSLKSKTGDEYEDFKNRILSLTGISSN